MPKGVVQSNLLVAARQYHSMMLKMISCWMVNPMVAVTNANSKQVFQTTHPFHKVM
jgi:hypothetical protein